jgi:hypothetical protein
MNTSPRDPQPITMPALHESHTPDLPCDLCPTSYPQTPSIRITNILVAACLWIGTLITRQTKRIVQEFKPTIRKLRLLVRFPRAPTGSPVLR